MYVLSYKYIQYIWTRVIIPAWSIWSSPIRIDKIVLFMKYKSYLRGENRNKSCD